MVKKEVFEETKANEEEDLEVFDESALEGLDSMSD